MLLSCFLALLPVPREVTMSRREAEAEGMSWNCKMPVIRGKRLFLIIAK